MNLTATRRQANTKKEQCLTLEMMDGPLMGSTYESDVFIDAANDPELALYRAGDQAEVFVAYSSSQEAEYVSVHALIRAYTGCAFMMMIN